MGKILDRWKRLIMDKLRKASGEKKRQKKLNDPAVKPENEAEEALKAEKEKKTEKDKKNTEADQKKKKEKEKEEEKADKKADKEKADKEKADKKADEKANEEVDENETEKEDNKKDLKEQKPETQKAKKAKKDKKGKNEKNGKNAKVSSEDSKTEAAEADQELAGDLLKHMLCILANNQGLNKESISFTIDYYMERFGLNCSRKEASRKLKKDLKVLQNMTFEHSDSKHKELNYINMKTVGTVLSAKGYITVYMDGVFRELLKKLSVVDTPKNLETIDYGKYPNAYGVTLYVYDMIYQEIHKNNNGRLLSVKSLLKNTFCYLPKEEHIKRSEQSPKHKILVPFINTLNYLEDRKYFTWEWRGRGNKELTDEEKNNIEDNFNLFKQAYVYFKLPSDYPNQSELIETRKEKIAAAKENKKLYNKELAKARAKRDAKKEAKI